MSTILVTGGTGFIGSNFVRHWLAHHGTDRVVNYDLLTYAANAKSLDDVAAREGGRYVFVHGDIRDYDRVLATIRGQSVDAIVNFAAESHNSRSVLKPQAFFETNVVGTVQLMRAALDAGVGRFHHISTCEVYGDLPLDADDAFTESSPLVPKTPYNASKAAADLAVGAFSATYGLPVTISNCANNYGPYQFPEKVIPHFVVSVLAGKPMTLYRSSRHRREWLHVDDHCRAIEAIIERGRLGETYNVGSGLEVDIEGIADRIVEILDASPALKTYVPDRPGHDRRYLLDSSKIRAELGWQPRIDFEEGFRDTVHWYRDNVDWWRGLLDRLDIDETSWQDPRHFESRPRSALAQAGAIA